VDVETTNARGFSPAGKRPAKRREVGEPGLVASVYGNRIADLQKAKRHADAVRAGLIASRVDPGNALVRKNTTAAFANWAVCLHKGKHHERAARVAAAGLRAFPKDATLANNHRAALSALVKARVDARDYKGALAALKQHGGPARAETVAQLRARVYSDWAGGLMKAEEWREAAEVLRAACDHFPKDGRFRAALKACKDRMSAAAQD
jgi:tetratricopeptide (TPR) repeat protein